VKVDQPAEETAARRGSGVARRPVCSDAAELASDNNAPDTGAVVAQDDEWLWEATADPAFRLRQRLLDADARLTEG
jgi:hypothetical protein